MTTDPTMIIGFAAVAVKTSASLRKLEQEMVPEGLGACDHEQGCQEGQLGGWGGGAEPVHVSGDADGIDWIEWMFVGI